MNNSCNHNPARWVRCISVGLLALGGAFLPQPGLAQKEVSSSARFAHSMNVKFEDIKWEPIFPEMGDRSPEIAFLRVDPETKATQLMIRAPKNFHVPRHWHTANETHTVMSGTFIMECEGKREELGPGSFNYVPSKMIHQAWTKPDEGALLFITVDAAWDINWVDGPPQLPGEK